MKTLSLHETKDALPVGVHFFGRFNDEATLFGLEGPLENQLGVCQPPGLERLMPR